MRLKTLRLSAVFLALTLFFASIPSFAGEGTGIYGGFIVNRKTKDKVALECMELSGDDCLKFRAVLIPVDAANEPSKWIDLNPGHLFSKYDLLRVEDVTKIRLQFRINPQGFNLGPIFPLTALVNFLAEQNENGTGKDLPIEELKDFTVYVDAALLLPTATVALSIWGVKKGIIAIQKNGLRKAFDSLEDANAIKKINRKNFDTMVELFRTYPWAY